MIHSAIKFIFIFLLILITGSAISQTVASFVPDTSVNKIKLLRWKSVVKKFKQDTTFIIQRVREHDDMDFPYADFLNEDGSQVILLYMHRGANDLAFSEIRIKYAKDYADTASCMFLSDKTFVSGKGVQLGMTKEEVAKLEGKPNRHYFIKGVEVYEYRIADPNTSFLKRYGQPAYFGYFKFTSNRLISFHIGFDDH